MLNPLDKIKKIYGTPVKAARAWGVDRQVVEKWYKNGYVPYTRGSFVMRKTKGQITAVSIWLFANTVRGD